MFILANVVDDIDMRITHVIRAEEHLPNTPKAILLWQALDGGELPVFAHVPLLVNEKRQKLSKRRDPVALELYRDEGYLPEAMQQLPDAARLGAVRTTARSCRSRSSPSCGASRTCNSSPAYFDVKKLEAFNGEYIRAMSTEEFVDRCQPWLVAPHAPWHPERFDRAAFESMAPLVQTRVTRLAEVPAMVDFMFLEEPKTDPASWDKAMKAPDAATVLDDTIAAYETVPWDADALKAALEMVGERVGPQAREGASAGPGRGHRSHCRPAALRVARRARSRAHTGALACCPRTPLRSLLRRRSSRPPRSSLDLGADGFGGSRSRSQRSSASSPCTSGSRSCRCGSPRATTARRLPTRSSCSARRSTTGGRRPC